MESKRSGFSASFAVEHTRDLGPITSPLCLWFAHLPKRNDRHNTSQGHHEADVTLIMEDAWQRWTRSECSKNVPISRKHTNSHTLANAFPILGGQPCSWPARQPFPPQRMTLFRRSCSGHWPSPVSDNVGETWSGLLCHPSSDPQ